MENKYIDFLLVISKKIDGIDKIDGSIYDLTKKLVNKGDVNATKQIFRLFKAVAELDDAELLQLVKKYNEVLFKYYGFLAVLEMYKTQGEQEEKLEEPPLSFDELIFELNNLIGLEKVKEKVNNLISFQKVQRLRKNKNLLNPQSTLHIAFIGNPGTGKTTVARIIGRMYKQLGLLSKGHFIEVSRTDLIAGYQGQTALKVRKIIEQAKGGVLFIDEAYSITENEHTDSYGRECLTELTKALEDYRDDLVVIVAGYKEPMEVFFNSNPGLKSRFNTFIEFEDYNVRQLQEILLSLMSQNDYKLSYSTLEKFDSYFENFIKDSTRVSANGRFVRNLFDDLITEHAKRVAKIDNPEYNDLVEINFLDIESVFTK